MPRPAKCQLSWHERALCRQCFGRTDTSQLRPALHSSRMDAAEGPMRLEKDVCPLLVTEISLTYRASVPCPSPDLNGTACEVLVQSHEQAVFL